MKDNSKQSLIDITASSSWWKSAISLLNVSTQQSRDTSETVSFLSCILIEKNDDGTFLHAESDVSTTYVIVDNEEVQVNGDEGKYLIKSSTLSSQLSSFPDDVDVTLSIDEKGEVSLYTDDNTILFTSLTEVILNEDATPDAKNDFPEDCLVFTCDVSELLYSYKMGSSMVKPKDKDISTSYDTLSGCLVTISDDGMNIMSASASSAETLIEGKVQKFGKLEKKKKPVLSSLTMPDATIAVLSKFEQSEEIEVCIDDEGFIHLDNGTAHVVVSPLNTNSSKIRLNYDLIMGVMSPAWENRIVTVSLPSKQLKEALSRAGSVHGDIINLAISGSTTKVSSKNSENLVKTPFSQKISCNTIWHDNEEAFFEIDLRYSILKKVYTMSPQNGEFVFDVAINPKNGNPWAIVVHTGEEFDPKKPHNFFVLNALQLSR